MNNENQDQVVNPNPSKINPKISRGIDAFDLGLTAAKINNSNFKEVVKATFFKTLRGKSKIELEGTSDVIGLVKLWPYLEKAANEEGVIGVIYRGGRLLPVSVSNLERDNFGQVKVKYNFSKNAYKQYSELKLILPKVEGGKTNGGTVEEIFLSEGDNKDKLFAILENDVDLLPDLVGIDSDLAKLEVILEAIFHDVIVSKKKLYFMFDQDPDAEEWRKISNLFNNKNIIGYISLEKSSKPDPKAGKEGFDINNVKLEIHQPDNKGRDLWADYYNWKKEIMYKYGIRFDNLENKKERASVEEVEQSTSYFDNIEEGRRQCRRNFVDWVMSNWGCKYRVVYAGK